MLCRYELLRTGERGNWFLDVIPVPSNGYNVLYLKSIASQAKVYIRPLQQSLSLEPICDKVVRFIYIVVIMHAYQYVTKLYVLYHFNFIIVHAYQKSSNYFTIGIMSYGRLYVLW